MNFIPSLLLYNPLEAMEILLLVGIFSKYKYDKFELLFHSFLYGAINLIFQYSASILMGTFSYAVITCLNNFVISPIILYLYLVYIVKINIDFKYSIVCIIIYYIINIFMIIVFNSFDIIEVFVSDREIISELISNMLIRLPQMFVVIYINLRKRHLSW